MAPMISRLVWRFKCLLAALICALAAVGAAAPAEAGLKFGPEENLRRIEDVRLQNSAKEALFIGHKVTFYWIGLPFAFSDDGYILGVKGKSLYYTVDKERLAEWQAQGLLPSPLPKYELHPVDYVFGHLLWIVLAGWVVWMGMRTVYTRRTKTQHAAAPLIASASLPAARVAQAISGPQPAKAPSAVAPTPANMSSASTAAAQKPAESVAAQPKPVPSVQHKPVQSDVHTERPSASRSAPSATQLRAEAAKLPVARTVCRVKAIKAA